MVQGLPVLRTVIRYSSTDELQELVQEELTDQ